MTDSNKHEQVLGEPRVPNETFKPETTQKDSKPSVNWPENLHFQGWFLRKMPSIQRLRGSEMLGSQARNKAPRSFQL